MPKDFKKMYLEEQSAKLKLELEVANLKRENEDLKKVQLFHQQAQIQNNPSQTPAQTSQFEADVKYIVGLSQRMSITLQKCRKHMLPMELGKEIDAVLREIERL
jgi:hypothetical protein